MTSLLARVRDCGMNFEWNLFEFTSRDCLLLAKVRSFANSSVHIIAELFREKLELHIFLATTILRNSP